ncbi:MAG: sulfate permease [Myxococcota bacterium]
MTEHAAPASARFGRDLIAGLTTAVLLVPQSMAYATLAGLPPVAGLYASTLPLFTYALFGRSPRLAVGPVAMDSLLTAATVGAIAEAGSNDYIALAITLALLVGLIQIALGLLRAGFLVNFLSRPVIVGFTSAAAVVIAASQLGALAGLELPRDASVFETLASFAVRASETHVPTLLLSAAAIALLVVLKRVAPKVPRALIVVALSGGLAMGAGIATVGEVPAGLPPLSLPSIPAWSTVLALLPGALAIALIGFMEAVSVHAALGASGPTNAVPMNDGPMNADRELTALGAANVAASFVGAFPLAGGLSRSAVNHDAGSSSRWAGVFTGTAVVLTLLFFTGPLALIPKAALSAIIVVAVLGLIDLREPKRLYRIKRSDLAMLALTFASTLAFGIRWGALIGVGLSLLALIHRATRPHSAVLGRLPGTEVYRNVERFPEAITREDTLILRLDAEVFFGNVNFLHERMQSLEGSRPGLQRVVLDASGINQIDAAGERALRELYERYEAKGICFVLAAVKGPVRDVLRRSGLMDEMGPSRFVLRTHDALATPVPTNHTCPRPGE